MAKLTKEFLTAFKILAAGQKGVEAKESSEGEDLARVKLSPDDEWRTCQVNDELIKEVRKLRRTPGISNPEKFATVVAVKLAKFLQDAPAGGGLAEQAAKGLDLFEAVRKGQRDQLGALLAGGADVNSTNDAGLTPLHLAAQLGVTEIIKLLIASGAELNAVDKDNQTALHHAALAGHTEAFNLLIDQGIDANMVDASGRTAREILESA